MKSPVAPLKDEEIFAGPKNFLSKPEPADKTSLKKSDIYKMLLLL